MALGAESAEERLCAEEVALNLSASSARSLCAASSARSSSSAKCCAARPGLHHGEQDFAGASAAAARPSAALRHCRGLPPTPSCSSSPHHTVSSWVSLLPAARTT